MKTTTVLVTGSSGFIGKHLVEELGRNRDVKVIGYDLDNNRDELVSSLAAADFVFHLAGVNRPNDPMEFEAGNAAFTAALCQILQALGKKPVVVMSSSIQAELNNPYGISKRRAEQALQEWSRKAGGRCVIFRLTNVFGPGCRPNYNSVVATFCHNIAHDLPITISCAARELELVYIDDVIAAFVSVLDEPLIPQPGSFRDVPRTFRVRLGELAETIQSFRKSRRSLTLPSLADDFTRCLYATYLSYLEAPDFAYNLETRSDDRGTLAEFLKSEGFGQIFVSRTKPGVTRGNHYHHTKAEKFLVLEGDAVIRFRSVWTGASNGRVIEHRVSGRDFRVVDIPPGYTHSIQNIGNTELVVLFWASEIFNPQRPETYPMEVLR